MPVQLAGLALACAGLCALVPASASAGGPKQRLAAKLLERDPGARVGGRTLVETAPGARIVGAPGRINFIMALGRGQRVVGGRLHDELGARVDGVRILGRGGHDMLFGAAGAQLLSGGRGDDYIRGGRGNDVVVPGSGENRIDVSDGKGHDRVLCAPGSTNRIRADRGERLNRHCRNRLSTVRYSRRSAQAAGQQVNGSGTNDDPYTVPQNGCNDPNDSNSRQINCFASRTLTGLWANEYVPAYECPTDFPYLQDESYAPGGTTLPKGIGVLGLGPIGMSITGVKTRKVTTPTGSTVDYASGTKTGSPNSSATNWTTGSASYQIFPHCEHDTANGWKP